MNNLPRSESSGRGRSSLFPFADRFLEEFVGRDWPFIGSVGGTAKGFPLDVGETDTHYVVYADLPGVRSDQVDITLEEHVLTISLQERKAQPQEGEGMNYLHRERWLGFVARSITLPREANPERIEAQMKDGILTVKIEKHPEKQPRKIKVSASE